MKPSTKTRQMAGVSEQEGWGGQSRRKTLIYLSKQDIELHPIETRPGTERTPCARQLNTY